MTERNADKDRERIEAFLKKHPEGVTVKAVAEATGMSRGTAQTRLTVMRSRGRAQYTAPSPALWRPRA